ncbi:MAG: response regulator [bacterium]|nr:response regulator [bacterium]
MDNIIDVLTIRAREKELELSYLVSPEVPPLLLGDPGRLRQILNNLLGNAIKFSHEGEVSLKVTLENEDEKADYVTLRFSIKDTGIGISEDKIDNLFQAFTQEDGSSTRKYGGTGLGLAISKQLAELMGGTVGAKGEPGMGSLFWFTAVFRKQKQSCYEKHKCIRDLKGVKVLVMDPNATSRQLLKLLMDSWDCSYDEAPDAFTALEKLRVAAEENTAFSIAVMDMELPGMNGEDLGKVIKGDPQLRETSLIMLSSIGKRGETSRFEKIGFEAYLPKPAKQEDLYGAMATIMGREHTQCIITRHTLAEIRKRSSTILVAEDNTSNRLVATTILEKLGFQHIGVANGLEAVEAYTENDLALILMDVHMPDLDGLEATKKIRTMETQNGTPRIPIIALTADAMQEDREKCFSAGMDAHITKPIEPQILMEVLTEWLSKNETPEPEKIDSPVSKEINGTTTNNTNGNAGSGPGHHLLYSHENLLQRMGNDKELAEKMLAVFIDDLSTQIPFMRECVAKDDLFQVIRKSHKLKGEAGTIGAFALQETAAAIEHAGQMGDSTNVSQLLTQMDEYLQRFVKEVKKS